MGNPVIHTAYVGEDKLSIRASHAKTLLEHDHNAEINFLDELDIDDDTPDDEVIGIDEPWWCGEGTSWDIDRLLHDVLPLTEGIADILVIYTDGELEGYRVEHGQVYGCHIDVTFVPRQAIID